MELAGTISVPSKCGKIGRGGLRISEFDAADQIALFALSGLVDMFPELDAGLD
jgi:hypothetical protein